MKFYFLLEDPGRVRSQIISVVCQIQWFDFDCNLVVTRKVIMGIPPAVFREEILYRHMAVRNLVY